jgi:ABC-2 type transport system ATP-binding protein/nitrous oxidase accessory protein
VITIRDLTKRFGAHAALVRISTVVPDGAFTLLLGANGAGKTTLLRCVLGLVAFEGAIRVGAHDVARDGAAARALLGYVPQRPSLPPDLTCSEVMDLFARLRGCARGDASWLERAGLAGSEAVPVRALSGGMQQRLALAVAMQADPAVLLFDEPASHLDVAARRALHQELAGLAGQGRTVVLATHLAAEPLSLATQVLVLHQGRLVYDGPSDRLGAAAHQRVIFAMNGVGREGLLEVLRRMPGVEVCETSAGAVATAPAGRAFDVVAAVVASGVRPLGVQVEEPAVDPVRVYGAQAEEIR